MSLFPKLTDEADYLKWFRKFTAVADGTGVGDVCDFSYILPLVKNARSRIR